MKKMNAKLDYVMFFVHFSSSGDELFDVITEEAGQVVGEKRGASWSMKYDVISN